MASCSNHTRLLVLTSNKSSLEYRITLLMNRTQQLAQQNAEILNEKYTAVQATITQQMKAAESDSSVSVVPMVDEASLAEFDAQIASIEAAQTRLDMEQKKLETQHKAVTAEQESVQKQLDNNIKIEYNHFGS